MKNVPTHTAINIRAWLGSNMLLTTAVVNVKSVDGKMFPARVLLDSGSQLLFITSTLVRNLYLCVNK